MLLHVFALTTRKGPPLSNIEACFPVLKSASPPRPPRQNAFPAKTSLTQDTASPRHHAHLKWFQTRDEGGSPIEGGGGQRQQAEQVGQQFLDEGVGGRRLLAVVVGGAFWPLVVSDEGNIAGLVGGRIGYCLVTLKLLSRS